MDPRRPKLGARKMREVFIVGTFTVLASLLSAIVPTFLAEGDAAPAAPSTEAEQGPLAVIVRNGNGDPSTATRLLCRLTPITDPMRPVDIAWSDQDGRCLWPQLPAGQYVVAVTRPGGAEAFDDEHWGDRLVTAPGTVQFMRATPYRTALITRAPGTPASPLTAVLVVKNPDDVPREVAVRCIWDEDRLGPHDALDTTESRVVAPGASATFPCGAAARPALAGRTLTLGYEIRSGSGGGLLTDAGWTAHRVPL